MDKDLLEEILEKVGYNVDEDDLEQAVREYLDDIVTSENFAEQKILLAEDLLRRLR